MRGYVYSAAVSSNLIGALYKLYPKNKQDLLTQCGCFLEVFLVVTPLPFVKNSSHAQTPRFAHVRSADTNARTSNDLPYTYGWQSKVSKQNTGVGDRVPGGRQNESHGDVHMYMTRRNDAHTLLCTHLSTHARTCLGSGTTKRPKTNVQASQATTQRAADAKEAGDIDNARRNPE